MTARPPSPEAFRTYRNYVDAWRYLVDSAGIPLIPPAAQPQLQLDPQKEEEILRSLQRCWGNLRALNILNANLLAAEVLAVHPPIAYYAVYNAVRAFLLARNMQPSSNHEGVLRQVSQFCQPNHLPSPWSARCTGSPDDNQVDGLAQAVTWPTSNLTSVTPGNAIGFAALALKTTRRKAIDHSLDRQRGQNSRLPNGARANKEQTLPPTTVFDMFYRFRRVAHYGSADDFTAFSTEGEGIRFAHTLFRVADATCRVVEKAAVERVGSDRFEEWVSDYAQAQAIGAGVGPVGERWLEVSVPF